MSFAGASMTQHARWGCTTGTLVWLTAACACPAAGHLWSGDPATYPTINRVQAAGGVVTYSVDLGRLLRSQTQTYTPDQVAELEAAVVRAFEKWNEVLTPVGLRFARAVDNRVVDVPVVGADYNEILSQDLIGDTIALSTSFPLNDVLNFSTILVSADEQFEPLDIRPTMLEPGLHSPYTRQVDYDGLDLYTTTVHEIGHQLGLGHPRQMVREERNYGFLALETVQVDPGCLTFSTFIGGEDLRARSQYLPTEIDSVMAPISLGTTITDVPPDDRAFVAFVLRELDPEGADQMLAEARTLFERSSPLRFANVVYEHEFEPGVRTENGDRSRAQPVAAGQIVLGSIVRPRNPDNPQDRDFYRFEVAPDQAGRVWMLDVDRGGGFLGVEWFDAALVVYDSAGTALATADDMAENEPLDAGSVSREDPFLQWTPPAAGTYFVEVLSLQPPDAPAAVGDYELGIGVEHEAVPTGNGDVYSDSSASSCTYEALEAHPLTPGCGPLGVVSLGITCWGLGALTVRRKPR